MFQYIRIFLIVSVVCGLCSCKDKAKEHKDELREGSWYPSVVPMTALTVTVIISGANTYGLRSIM